MYECKIICILLEYMGRQEGRCSQTSKIRKQKRQRGSKKKMQKVTKTFLIGIRLLLYEKSSKMKSHILDYVQCRIRESCQLLKFIVSGLDMLLCATVLKHPPEYC